MNGEGSGAGYFRTRKGEERRGQEGEGRGGEGRRGGREGKAKGKKILP